MFEKLKIHDGDTPGKVIEVKLEYQKPKVATMRELKCPFCKKELKMIGEKSDSGYPIDEYFCGCPQTAFHFGNTPMWNELRVLHEKLEEKRKDYKLAEQELIRTRKALDVAVDVLKLVYQGNGDPQDIMRYKDNRWTAVRRLCMQALAEITALEQKD